MRVCSWVVVEVVVLIVVVLAAAGEGQPYGHNLAIERQRLLA